MVPVDFKTMFRALVISGSVSAAGCAGKHANPPSTTALVEKPARSESSASSEESVEEFDAATCMELCSYSDAGTICPEPMNDIDNCCWLMLTPHPCCDVEPRVDGPSVPGG